MVPQTRRRGPAREPEHVRIAVGTAIQALSERRAHGKVVLDIGRRLQEVGREMARLRRAVPGDAAALVHLRVTMLEAMGAPVGDATAPWRAAALDWFTRSLSDPQTFAAFVIEDPGHGLVSNASGLCDRHAPGPGNPGGLRGHVFNISTVPHARGRGHARDCLSALLRWFADDTTVSVVDLNATPGGERLYRTLGFAPPRHPALQLRRDQM